MRFSKTKFIFVVPVIAATAFATIAGSSALAGSTGSVKTQVTNAPVGHYRAWLFRTGDRQPSQVKGFNIAAYKAPVIQFDNVTTGSHYFIRVVDDTCMVGGQSSDGYLKSGTLGLPRCQVTDGWTSGCP